MSPRTISTDELDGFQIDENGRLYWRGKGVILEQKISLRWWELSALIVGALGALLAGVHPFGVTFGWW
jgi:hypothetical protein